MADKNRGAEAGSEILLYRGEDGRSRIEVRLERETVWLTQNQMAELYETTKQNISLHIQKIFDEGELSPGATVKQYLTVQTEGLRTVKRVLDYFNLDLILAVGYRVRSLRGTQFRQWATERLREYLVKGFTMDDDRLKDGRIQSSDYFEELLERIRDIRASERMFYQKITDIYSTSMDYDPDHRLTREFFATVQNKMHWAIHGRTAAEIIAERSSADRPNMGLMTWKRAPKGKIRRADVTVAKNYLKEDELRRLNRIVTMYLDYAELQVEERRPMTMKQWIEKLDAFLHFTQKQVLSNPGKVSAEVAKSLAEGEFEKYSEKLRKFEVQNPVSDFDRMVRKLRKMEAKKAKKY